MDGSGIRGLKARVRWKCCISRGGPNSTMEVYELEESEEEGTVLSPEKAGTQQEAAPAVRPVKSAEFGEEE